MIEPTDSIVATADNLKKASFTINEWYQDKNKLYLEVQSLVTGTAIKSKYAYQESTSSGIGLTYNDNSEIIDSQVFLYYGSSCSRTFLY